MKKRILTLFTAIAIILVLTQTQIANAVASFFFIGLVPGTNYSMPFWAMMSINGFLGLILLSWLSHQSLYIGDTAYQEKLAKERAREKVIQNTISRANSKANRSGRRVKRDYKVATSSTN